MAGGTTNGTGASGPYQLKAAANDATPALRTGHLTAKYDDAGNLTSLAVKRDGPCLPVTAICSQRFVYDWDEVGRLARARRWDLLLPGAASDAVPTGTPAVELKFAYDAGAQRTTQTAADALGADP